ncbi:MAG: SRPBCC domain-containing protein [Iamia sp.]
MSPRENEVGRTKDAGWQIGVSRTVAHPVERVWDLLTCDEGTALWLGSGVTVDPQTGQGYETEEGTVGETRSHRFQDRIRLTWQPENWDHETTVQVAVVPNGPDRTMIRFHQERLANAEERERQRTHWRGVMDAVTAALDPRDAPDG